MQIVNISSQVRVEIASRVRPLLVDASKTSSHLEQHPQQLALRVRLWYHGVLWGNVGERWGVRGKSERAVPGGQVGEQGKEQYRKNTYRYVISRIK
jgi:hypothetical protein